MDDAIKDSEVKQDKIIHRINFTEFTSKVNHGEQFKILEQHFDVVQKENKTLNSNDFTIITDDIVIIEKNDISYYTFKIAAPSENNEFYNLVVHVNNEQEILKTELYEYIPTSTWLEDISQPFIGQVQVLDHANISIDQLVSDKAGKCLVGATGSWECNEGNPHAPGEGTTCTSWEYYLTLEYGPCPPEEDVMPVNIFQEAPSPGSGGGGSTPNQDQTPTIPTTPCHSNDGQITIGITNSSGGCLNLNSVTDIETIENCVDTSNLNMNTLSDGSLATISHFISINGCNAENAERLKDFIELLLEEPNAKLYRYYELLDLIEANPWALIQDCAVQNGLNTTNYLELYNQTLPLECSEKLSDLGLGWNHQPITDGNVPLANIDYYGVEITNRPDFNNDGSPDSNSDLFQAFREKFIDVGSGDLQNFQFSCDIPFNSTDTGDISWAFEPNTDEDGSNFISNDPIASILLIEANAAGILPSIATDDGAVMVSDFTSNHWTVSTITTPFNGTQPFSGNRQWGWLINQNGNFEIFTRAVDVANISTLLNLGASTECQQETYYDIAQATWENMQQEIVSWINNPNSNGGQASISTTIAIPVDKEKIKDILTSNETIDEINCN
jgi:hypothetical protein